MSKDRRYVYLHEVKTSWNSHSLIQSYSDGKIVFVAPFFHLEGFYFYIAQSPLANKGSDADMAQK